MILEKSRKGTHTAKINNKYLHSKYDPEKEAEQFVNHWLDHNPCDSDSVILVLEPGLGYLIRYLSESFKSSQIIILFFSQDTYQYCRQIGLLNGISFYSPDEKQRAGSFVSTVLQHKKLKDIKILDWPASHAAFPDISPRFRQEILGYLRIRQGNELTQRHFSYRWFINGIRNYLRHDYSLVLDKTDSPVILAASGPTLEYHIKKIREYQDRLVVAALPSSLCILKEYNIVPDLIFTTDSGYYAREHLRHSNPQTICISPVTASMIDRSKPILGLNQKSYVEKLLYNNDDIVEFPEMGTVGATAIHFLKSFTSDTVYISGLDFCMKDIKMHAQPHSFNSFILKNESRMKTGLTSFYTRAYDMTSEIKKGFRYTRNMNTYTSWFNRQPRDSRIVRLKPAPVSLPYQTCEHLPSQLRNKKNISISENTDYPSYGKRRKKVKKLYDGWKRDFDEYKKNGNLSENLRSLVFELFPRFLNSDTDKSYTIENHKEFLIEMDELLNKLDQLL